MKVLRSLMQVKLAFSGATEGIEIMIVEVLQSTSKFTFTGRHAYCANNTCVLLNRIIATIEKLNKK